MGSAHPLIPIEDWLLRTLHDLGLAWGSAIVVLTLIVRVSLVPLTLRQRALARRATTHAPQLRAVREAHTDDPAARKAALREYRSRHGIPGRALVAGIVIQLFVLASVALLLVGDAREHIDGAAWLFIDDLGERADASALAYLMAGWITAQIASAVVAGRTSRRRMLVPLLAVAAVLPVAAQLPAALLLFFFVSALFSLAQRPILSSRDRRVDVAAPAVATA